MAIFPELRNPEAGPQIHFNGYRHWRAQMPSWMPGIVPYGADQTVYVVVDGIGAKGGVSDETEIERNDREAMIRELIAGQFNDPLRIVAFNTLEHWANDVSEDIATEIQTRFDIEGNELPEHIRDFVENHRSAARPPSLHPA